MMVSGIRRSNHTLPCTQNPASVTSSSTEGRCTIIVPWESHIIDDRLLLNFDKGSGYLDTHKSAESSHQFSRRKKRKRKFSTEAGNSIFENILSYDYTMRFIGYDLIKIR